MMRTQSQPKKRIKRALSNITPMNRSATQFTQAEQHSSKNLSVKTTIQNRTRTKMPESYHEDCAETSAQANQVMRVALAKEEGDAHLGAELTQIWRLCVTFWREVPVSRRTNTSTPTLLST
jgi:hypothetical protein